MFVLTGLTAAEPGKVLITSELNCKHFFLFAFLLAIWNNRSCLAKIVLFDRRCERMKKRGWRTSTARSHGNSGCEPCAQGLTRGAGRSICAQQSSEGRSFLDEGREGAGIQR